MVAGAEVRIQGFTFLAILFSFLASVAAAMTSQEDIVQAILDLRTRLDASEAVVQKTRYDNVRLNNLLAQSTAVGGRPQYAPPPPPTNPQKDTLWGLATTATSEAPDVTTARRPKLGLPVLALRNRTCY